MQTSNYVVDIADAVDSRMISTTGIADIRPYHPVIMEAIANGGNFTEDFADIFKLTKASEGSPAEYILTFV
jgi:hypothetical protein